MNRLQEMTAQTALNRMFKDSHFSICTIDNIIKMLSVVPNRKAYEILHTLHCVEYKDMPTELYQELPNLIRECLSLQHIFEFDSLKPKTIKISPMERLIKLLN